MFSSFNRSFFSLLILALLTLLSCQSSTDYEGKKILRMNIPEGLSSLDPAYARTLENVNITKQLFDGLVDLDADLNIVPSVAEKWEILEEGILYRFHLRKDVRFHSSKIFGADSTRSVTAHDFVYSFDRLVNKKILSPGKWVLNYVQRQEDGSLDIKAVDEHTLEIRLQQSFPPFLGILSMQYCSVVPREAFETASYDFLKHPIGTGAFQFKYWKEGGKLILLKNQDYFQSTEENPIPKIDAVAVSFIRDQEVVFLKFLKGELDFISGLKGSYKDELLTSTGELREKYLVDINFSKFPYLNTEYLGFQMEIKGDIPNYLNSLDLRRAINFAIDRKKMMKFLRNDIGYPANSGFIPRGLPPFDENANYGYKYNKDSVEFYLNRFQESYAVNLLQEKIILGTTSEYLDICEYVQHQLEEFGIGVRIEVNQAATANEMIAFGKIPFFRKSWIADYPEAENYLSLFISTNFSPSGPNYTHFQDSTYDDLFQKSLLMTNDSLRKIAYRKLDSLLMSKAPIVPLFYDQQVHFKSTLVSNFTVNPMSHLMLKYVDKQVEEDPKSN